MGDFLNLEGRIAVVTGGARGIGLAITRALIGHGVRVHVFDVAPGVGDDAAPYSFHQADIADSASV
ncbi:MAG TPA: NAD-dependent epimerase/dehydratase family protein, partial [Candidatus Lokiarchaeia archaeon]|nr:NAD-dependent epimerase/dehydratase family protein [Candidatus Lokiarchaeia archaeon]